MMVLNELLNPAIEWVPPVPGIWGPGRPRNEAVMMVMAGGPTKAFEILTRVFNEVTEVSPPTISQSSSSSNVTLNSIFLACTSSLLRNAANFDPPRIPGHLRLVQDGRLPSKTSSMLKPLPTPCRKRSASRKLDFPLALAPTSRLKLPSLRSTLSRLLKFRIFNSQIITSASVTRSCPAGP